MQDYDQKENSISSDYYLEVLGDIAGIINHTTDFQDIIAKIIEKVDQFMGCESGGILLYDEHKHELVLQEPSFGQKGTGIESYRLPVMTDKEYRVGTAVEVFLSRTPYICNNPSEDKNARQDIIARLGIHNFATIPLTIKDKGLGVLHAINKRSGDFTQEDVLFLNTLGASIAMILEMTRQQNSLKRLVQIQSALTEQVVQGQGLNEIVNTLSKVLHLTVLLEDRFFQPLYFAKPLAGSENDEDFIMPALSQDFWMTGSGRSYYKEMIHKKKPITLPALPDQSILHPRLVAPIVVEEEIFGYLSVGHVRDGLEGFEIAAVTHAATICSVEFLKQLIALKAENSVKGDLIRDLLTDRLQLSIILERASIMGYDLSQSCQVIGVSLGENPANVPLRKLYEVVCGFVHAQDPHIMVLSLEGEVLILAYTKETTNRQFLPPLSLAGAVLHNAEELLGTKVYIGIGQVADEPAKIKQSYQEALSALRALPQFSDKKSILCFEEMGIFRLLSKAREQNELVDFAQKLLKPLINYDLENNTFLIPSLKAYFDANCSVQKTAQKAYLHPNTLLYRLKRIQEITGFDLNDTEDRLNLQIALRILQFYSD
ncbi:helix-turn-helix domain-containing protein [Paradesulfitobacterium ferrireducens]|uniref:helix-turn-helix domain-containing protein n=1 Tax=Paradesulfitobacterium ferrireducens TaxID=2816476 RepID=UPI001A8E8B24|nr:helix-turn-helix domain-containing protein [Paradesulfitobacterium ferrireducens]